MPPDRVGLDQSQRPWGIPTSQHLIGSTESMDGEGLRRKPLLSWEELLASITLNTKQLPIGSWNAAGGISIGAGRGVERFELGGHLTPNNPTTQLPQRFDPHSLLSSKLLLVVELPSLLQMLSMLEVLSASSLSLVIFNNTSNAR